MTLLTPEIGLQLWQVLVFFNMVLLVVSWAIIFKTKTFDLRDRLVWLLGTLFLPILGPLIFLTKFMMPRQKNQI